MTKYFCGERIYSHRNFFRQTISSVIYFVNALLSRNFAKKAQRESKLPKFPLCCAVVWKGTLKRGHDFNRNVNVSPSNQRFYQISYYRVDFTKFLSVIAFNSTFPVAFLVVMIKVLNLSLCQNGIL